MANLRCHYVVGRVSPSIRVVWPYRRTFKDYKVFSFIGEPEVTGMLTEATMEGKSKPESSVPSE